MKALQKDIKIVTSVEFVELISSLFDLATQQDEKLTLAKSFGKKQDRYELLAGDEAAALIDALVGKSVFQDIRHDNRARTVVLEFLAYAQLLVSWLQASLVHQAIDQEDIAIHFGSEFGSPQFLMLIYTLLESDLLQKCSPLRMLPDCVEALLQYECDPIRACKETLRSRIQASLGGREPKGIGFFKHINSLDPRSSTRPSTQRHQLKELYRELRNILSESRNRALVEELTGIYAAMMALNQLHRRMSEMQPQFFPALIRRLHSDWIAIAMSARHSNDLILHRELFLLMMVIDGNTERLTAQKSNTESFRLLLESHPYSSTPGMPNQARDFLRDGLTTSFDRAKLELVMNQLKQFQNKPFFNGVSLFIFGLFAINEQDPQAKKYFEQCLVESERWPLGIFRSQAAVFSLGLQLAQEPGMPPNAWNPLLSVYLDSAPQHVVLGLEGAEVETVEMYNLRELIGQYNTFCWALIGGASAMTVNPFRKIEAYLQKIRSELQLCVQPLTIQDVEAVSKRLTTKRDVERVKSDFYGTSLYQWLSERHIFEVSRIFRNPEMWELIPAIEWCLDLKEPLRAAIARASDPSLQADQS